MYDLTEKASMMGTHCPLATLFILPSLLIVTHVSNMRTLKLKTHLTKNLIAFLLPSILTKVTANKPWKSEKNRWEIYQLQLLTDMTGLLTNLKWTSVFWEVCVDDWQQQKAQPSVEVWISEFGKYNKGPKTLTLHYTFATLKSISISKDQKEIYLPQNQCL